MNWYNKHIINTAQNKPNKEKASKRPYNIFKVNNGQFTQINKKDDFVMAFSEEQARKAAFQIYPIIQDILEISPNTNIVVQLDKASDDELRNFREYNKNKKEEVIQNAWWNKDD